MERANIIFMKFSSKEVASYFVANSIYRIFGKMQNKQTMLLGTATGQTPVLTYKELIEMSKNSDLFNDHADELILRQLDNYISPQATKDNLPEYSYELELRNSIWQIPNGGAYIPKEYADDPEEEAKRYAELIKETNEKANFIIQLLGIGDEDGHIAFNMPGDSFDSTVHVVELNEETIRANANKFFGGDMDKVPKKAITTGIGDILKSDLIILEAFGKKKADIIWKSFFTEPTTDIPATALQTVEGSEGENEKFVFVILDEESAAVIEEKEEDVFVNPEDVIDCFIKYKFD